MTPASPPKSPSPTRAGRFARADFQYDPQADGYLCPQGQALAPQGHQDKRGEAHIRYASRAADCRDCPLRARCLAAKYRTKSLTV